MNMTGEEMMALIPRNNPLDALNDKVVEGSPRSYLGLSQVGDSCHRRLQHNHYWTYNSTYDARIARLFQVGHDAEEIMIADLATIGIIVTDQQEEIVGVGGHWKGHTDGRGHILAGSPADIESYPKKPFLTEYKTHNDKSFKDLKKNKVRKSKPTHYRLSFVFL
jgi:hypothetical protein